MVWPFGSGDDNGFGDVIEISVNPFPEALTVPEWTEPVQRAVEGGIETHFKAHVEYGEWFSIHDELAETGDTLHALTYDETRGQYEADRLSKGAIPLDGDIAFLVTDVDLYSAGKTHVFGVGLVGADAALFSIHRLRESEDGWTTTETERVRKQSIKLLGWLLEAEPCDTEGCVMASVRTVEALDRQDEYICDDCRELIGPARLR